MIAFTENPTTTAGMQAMHAASELELTGIDGG
jgi:hypothetical protein